MKADRLAGTKAEEARKRASAWYYANRQRAKETQKKYREANRDKASAYALSYRAENIDRLREYDRQRAKNPERKAAHREWRIKNSSVVVARVNRWREENPERAAALHVNSEHRRRARLKRVPTEAVDLFRFRVMAEPVCGICGQELDKNEAHVDHIIPLAKGGGHVWGNLQLAHPECNRKKGASIQDRVYSI